MVAHDASARKSRSATRCRFGLWCRLMRACFHPQKGLSDMLVMLRFEVDQNELDAFLVQLRAALVVLANRPGYIEGSIGRATDQPGLVLLATRWQDVGSYRRALGNYDVKVEVVPLLSRAINEASAYEVVHTRDEHGVHDAPSSLATDAGSVRLGEAAGPGS